MKKIFITLFSVLLITLLSGCGEKNLKLNLMPSTDTVEINTEWKDEGAKIVIKKEKEIVYSKDSVDLTKLGLYKLSYTYEYKDKIYETIRYVIVTDQTKPEIILNPGVDTVKLGEEWTNAGAIVSDNSKEELEITTIGVVDINKIGSYEIKYEATDSSGNRRTVIRIVDVV